MLHAEFQVLLQHGFGKIRIHGHVHQELVHALQAKSAFEREHQPRGCQDGILIFFSQPFGVLGCLRHTVWIVHLRPIGVILQIFEGGRVRQRMVAWEPHARFNFGLPDAPIVNTGGMRVARTVTFLHISGEAVQHAARIAVQALHGLFVDLGRTQFGPIVYIIVRGLNSQFLFQRPIRFHFDTGGIADADDDRHPVRHFVVQYSLYTLT